MRIQAELFAIILFSLLILIYLFSLNPILPSGDAGGLITASYFLGIAHPPGYPLYIELGKLITFLPFGNIGFRLSLLPPLFSILSLLMLYYIIKELLYFNERLDFSKEEYLYLKFFPLVGILFLGLSYSFYFQTIIGKFYPLNLFLVTVLTFLGMKVLKEGFDRRYAYLCALILGISTALHHTALFMIIPLAILGFFYFKPFLKSLPLSLIFFLLGFSINLHIYLRNLKGAFAAVRKEGFALNFLDIILRKFYKEGESLQVLTSAVSKAEDLINAFKNFLYMIDANFGYITLLFFILGAFHLLRKNVKLFLFLFSAFLMFSFVLSKLTFSGSIEGNEGALYIVGNQYFLPAFFFYVIFFVEGIYLLTEKIKNYKLLHRAIPLLFIVLPLIFIPMRYTQTSQANNWALYYYSKDLLSTMPVSAVLNTYGDNKSFDTWYLKLVGRYRDDVCHTVVFRYESLDWNLEGCKPQKLYEVLFPEVYKKDMITLIKEGRYFSTIGLNEIHPLYEVAYTKPYVLSYFYISKESGLPKERINSLEIISLEKFLTPSYCLIHGTDDPLTFAQCRFVALAYLNIASYIIPMKPEGVFRLDTTIRYGSIQEPYKVNIIIGKENEKYMELYERIIHYNDRRKAYLLP